MGNLSQIDTHLEVHHIIMLPTKKEEIAALRSQ